jgi:putative ABC transport system permease protein
VLLQDFRYALRSLWRARTFAVVAILCLGFGIGLNATIFSVVDGVLLKPFPYADPDRILVLHTTNEKLGVSRDDVSYLDWQDLRAAKGAFTQMAALQFRSLALSDGEHDPARYAAAAVSWDLFALLGVAPVVGSGFTPEMDRTGAPGVVMLGYSVWRDRYQSDPNIAGRRVFLNGEPAVVVGVMPEHFEFPNVQKIWIPLAPTAAKAPRQQRDLFVLGRLAPNATMASAAAELRTTSAALERQFKETNEGWVTTPSALRDEFIPADVTRVIWIMMASVTLVLFIACSNVANLQLARAATRQREFSMRSALGAGRPRLVRQLLTESVVLSLVSLPLGIVLAKIGTQLIASAMPTDQVPAYITWALDWRSLAYTVAVAVATAVLFGMLPALQASRGNLVESLKDGARGAGARRSKLRNALVIVQVSLALVALVGALLFVRSFTNLDSYAVGFDPKPLFSTRFYLPGAAYEAPDAKARRVEDVVRRMEALPQVESAFASNLVPISGGGAGYGVVIDGQSTEAGKEPFISLVGTTPHFHRTLGVGLTAGRDFTDAEGWSSMPLAIINTTMARQFWGTNSPLGSRFRLATTDAALSTTWFTIIGVAPDIKHDDIDPEDEPFAAAYVPYHFQQTFSTGLTIRVTGDPLAITGAVRAALKASDSNLPMGVVRTLDEVRRLGFWQYALFGWIFGVTGVVGLLLASVGVYGVLSYTVSQRTPEIGVRMALGAQRRDVLHLIVSHGVMLAGSGVAIGLVLAPMGTWFGRSLFYNVSPFDPLTFVTVAGFLMTVAFLASYLPARRATRVNPVQALRGE